MTDRPATHDPNQQTPLDQELALKAAAQRLEDEFDGVVSEAAIEDHLHSSYDHFADHATIVNYLPLLAERYTREWLFTVADSACRYPQAGGTGPPRAQPPPGRRCSDRRGS
ncbi:three-helix bundle dimerization domain-containing protein, partial [Nocardia abscessus]|uniref:three-helix bundle dimerization domain-containing protein n=1 Tax=Nocardia abscessus TaxID=120957 RepID=UPI003CC7D56E